MNLQGQELSCLGYGCGNITAAVNDGRADPMAASRDDVNDKAPNVALMCIAVGSWPFNFMVAIEDIEEGVISYALAVYSVEIFVLISHIPSATML